jgi:two-component system OmpR family response regulator
VRILLVENNKQTASPVRNDLRDLGHEVTVAASGADALYLAASQEWELLIIDRTALELDALGVVRTLRGGGVVTPVLLLNRPGDDAGIGIDAGADHCLDPGFKAAELAARVAALGRSPRRAQPETLLRVADVEIDVLTRSVRRGGRSLELQPREFRLLEYLARNAGTVLGRTTLLEKVWDCHFDPRTNVVESHITRLRAKIDRGFAVPLIHTIRGAGYCLREPD